MSEVDPPDADAMTSFLDFIPTLVTQEDNAQLMRPVSMEEVKTAVFALDPESAAGPDGYSGRFYQACWEIISPDLLTAVQEFFAGVPLPKSVASGLIVLLPKKEYPSSFGDYRPICLCNFINKIFTRILCDRMKVLLPRLISEDQSAFLSGRDITDSILLGQEVVQHLDKRVRGHNIFFKLDMMKVRVSELRCRNELLSRSLSPQKLQKICEIMEALAQRRLFEAIERFLETTYFVWRMIIARRRLHINFLRKVAFFINKGIFLHPSERDPSDEQQQLQVMIVQM